MDIELNILKNWIEGSDNIVFITGKDFSAEAGFPDYRAMDEDFLDKYKYPPDDILCLTFLQRCPMFFYRYYRDKILAPVLNAQPSPAHEALAKLEESGKLKAILTVNIDGIHQEAGSKEVMELHGSVMRSWCAKCEKFLDFFYIADSPTPIPYCNVDMCGDYVRPAIVLKEEPYDLDLVQKALDYVKAADMLLIDGSALAEFPVPNLMKAYLPTSKTPIRTGKKVAVVGGGNVAMDAARSALRLGAETVYIVYRRGMAELPARKEEVEHAEEEGIIFKTLCNPVEILPDEDGFVKAITCIEMELGEPDASGRRRPIEKKGSEFTMDVDTVIMSLGTSPNPLIRSTTPGLETNKHGCIVTEGDEGKTSREGVYAGGDAVTGAATVIKAMGAGKAAAKAIDEYIQSK